MPRSVTTSSHCQGALPVTQAVPSIMLSKTTVSPEARSPSNAVCCRPVRLYRGVSAMSAGNSTGWSCRLTVISSPSSRSARSTCSGANPGP